MLGTLTYWGISVLRRGSSAPLWRTLVTLDNAVCLNWLAAVVVAACFAYAIKKLFFQRGPRDDPKTSTKVARVTPYLTWIPFFVVPAYVDQLAGLSPFFFSLMPSALALAVLCSLNEKVRRRNGNDEDEPLPRLMWLRLLLSGACAAIGAWEGTLGLLLAVVVLMLVFLPCINREESVSKLMFLWLLGFLVAFLIEGICLGWPWAAFRPARFPIVGTIVFLAVTILPVAVVRTLGEKWWVLLAWGVVLAVLTTNALVGGRYWRVGGCERFARKVLAELGDRKLIIGDGYTDDFFRELKPADVRLVGSRTFEDREFLISFFDEKEPVSKRALVVRHYHYLPEMEDVAEELGLEMRKPQRPAKQEDRKRAQPMAMTEAMRAQAATNEMRRVEKLARPFLKSIHEMTEELGKIPVSQRKVKVEEARANIRKGWGQGFGGLGMSSTVLALDIMLDDWEGAESDALTALTIDRDDPAANAMLGNIRLRKRQFDKAERYLRKGVVGGGTGAYNDLAMLLVKTGRAAEAEEWAKKAMAKAPKDWNFRETYVQVLMELGRQGEALKELAETERLAKEQKQYEQAKETLNVDRYRILRMKKR